MEPSLRSHAVVARRTCLCNLLRQALAWRRCRRRSPRDGRLTPPSSGRPPGLASQPSARRSCRTLGPTKRLRLVLRSWHSKGHKEFGVVASASQLGGAVLRSGASLAARFTRVELPPGLCVRRLAQRSSRGATARAEVVRPNVLAGSARKARRFTGSRGRTAEARAHVVNEPFAHDEGHVRSAVAGVTPDAADLGLPASFWMRNPLLVQQNRKVVAWPFGLKIETIAPLAD